MRRLLVLIIALLLTSLCALSAFGAEVAAFELQRYSDPAGRLSVDLPKGWTVVGQGGNIIHMSRGTASFLITEIKGAAGALKLADALPKLIEDMKKTPGISNLEIVEKGVSVSGTRVNLARAKISFLISGKMDYVSDIYVIGGPDGRARYGLATFAPAGEQSNYRSLFDAVVQSISVSDSSSGGPVKLLPSGAGAESPALGMKPAMEVFNAPGGLYRISIPSGWKKRDVAGCTVAVSDGTAYIGLMEASELHRSVAPLETLPEVIGQLRQQTETFKGLRIVEKPSLIHGTDTAHAEITYTQGGKEICADFYVIGAGEGSRLILMAHTPAAERSRYSSLFDSVAKSVSFSSGPVK